MSTWSPRAIAMVRKQFVLRIVRFISGSAVKLLQNDSIGSNLRTLVGPSIHLHRQRVWRITLLNQSFCVEGKRLGMLLISFRLMDFEFRPRIATSAMNLRMDMTSESVRSESDQRAH